ncbi:MAG TPA: class I SAM-dependent methyltransferase [Bacteroidia bacterium]|jgi:SAM-dependent methyltransferase|nr:class I SAM-dependent methyltransferase [Bacteroidia bacterium]
MKVFEAYSEYYDLLYSTKDYAAEADYIDGILKKHHSGTSIIELGCGTGLHACLLAKKGYTVNGIDLSDVMLDKAAARKKNLSSEIAKNISFDKGDIRSFTNEKKYDAAISLFHVISYMTSDNDLKSAIITAKKHLNPKGLFIFDCWYGPGVLHDKPVTRIKKFENREIAVKRHSVPEMFPEKNVIDVHFEINIHNKKTSEDIKLNETHSMRYLFTDELKNILEQNGFEIICAEEWMTKNELSEKSWNACYVCRNKS